MRMQEIDIHDYARQLLEAHGDKAVAEAAQKGLYARKPRRKRTGENLETRRGSAEADTWTARKLTQRLTGDQICSHGSVTTSVVPPRDAAADVAGNVKSRRHIGPHEEFRLRAEIGSLANPGTF